jgi:rare lipoprotein A
MLRKAGPAPAFRVSGAPARLPQCGIGHAATQENRPLAEFWPFFAALAAPDTKSRGSFGFMRHLFTAGLALAALVSLAATDQASAQCGRASWYALTSKTASGEYANPNSLTAAHRSLPFGTKVKVENLKNGRSVVVRINDRGPFVGGRVIDVTRAAAKSLGFMRAGTATVRVTVLGSRGKQPAC